MLLDLLNLHFESALLLEDELQTLCFCCGIGFLSAPVRSHDVNSISVLIF